MFQCWSHDVTNDVYYGTGTTVDRLPAGYYALYRDDYRGCPAAKRLEPRKDEILPFAAGPLKGVLEEARRFWASAEHYRDLGVSHKRGILLHGPHGCGKTGIISCLIEETVREGGLAVQVNDVESFTNGLPLARQVENGRRILVILEDLEHFLPHDEEEILEMMDGTSSPGDGLLFVATTNKLKDIPPRIRCRPSRIDTLIEIGHPRKELRQEYLKFLLSKNGARAKAKEIDDLVSRSDGFSLAQLKELVVSVRVYGKTVKESVARLSELKNGDS